MSNPFDEMRQLVHMMKDRRLLNVHMGLIANYMKNNNVSREDAIAALTSQGLLPRE